MEELKQDEGLNRSIWNPFKLSKKPTFWNSNISKRILFFLKIILTIVILWFIFKRIDFQEVFRAALEIRSLIIVILLVITLLKFIIQLKNWEQCLKITAEYNPPRYEVLKSHFIGYALRFLIPGGHATFAKVYYVSNKKKVTLFSIGIERFMLTWTNLWFAAWAGLFYFSQVSFMLRLAALVLITLIPLVVYWSSRILKKAAWKAYFSQFIKLVPIITGRQAFFLLLTVMQYYLIISQFQEIGIFSVLVSVPLILIANLIPITYAGLGLRESFAIHLFRTYSIEPAIAVTASLVIFVINSVLPALVGALFLLTAKGSSTRKGKNLTLD